ncbi:APC family permease [Caballeronia sp. LZ032]|uniref:APC family permease n=1 Tax=Caballeronia sp. LZ032 TaxID=3038565 RepID=UPI00285E6A35|nr:APC family permease [Caballeronia sp. LZ032]MDR5877759.1 APC family permease [Caballeronia sp. LZ032]
MSTESFGYKQELKRTLGFVDLVIYGVIFMIPIAPFAIYGYVADAAGGMVALAYVIGMVAMLFTALSYKVLSEDFPIAGSAYAYAQRGIGETAGFFTGWMLILDYLLIPALTYVVAASALSSLFPLLPKWLWIVAFLLIGTVTNYVGVQVTAAANRLFLIAQILVLIIFCVCGLYSLYHGEGAGRLTLNPLFQPASFKPIMIFSAVSVCALSFLGFDGISMLAEEVRGNSTKTVGNATVVSLLCVGALFVLQTWIAADLAAGLKFKSLDTAFYEIAEVAGGKPLSLLTAWSTALTFGVSCSIASQTAIARLLYSMARDRKLPLVLARVHSAFKTPHVSLVSVSIVSLGLSLGFLDHLDTLTNFVNFGALSGFMMLHVAVISHFIFRKRSRSFLKHLLSPAIGFVILAYVLYSMGMATWELGVAWCGFGIVYYFILKKIFHRNMVLDV